MKFKLQEIDDYNSNLYKTLNPIGMQRHYYLKPYYERHFQKFADINENGIKDFSSLFYQPDITEINDKNYLQSRGQLKREFKNLLKQKFQPEITDASVIKTINQYLLNESLICLNRSIYWFLNYYRNMDGFSLNPKLQNLYYSELFIHLSIARYLGLAYTWISELSLPIKTQIQKINNDPSKSYEENMKIQVVIAPKISGMHETIFIQVRYHIEENIDFPTSTISQWFEPSYIASIFKDERETVVYDISSGQNDPWYFSVHKGLAEEYSNYCFLNGEKEYYTGDPDVDQYIYDKYGDWGYREAHIGGLIKWMTERLRAIKANGILRTIAKNIKNFDVGLYPNSFKKPKSILLKWFTP